MRDIFTGDYNKILNLKPKDGGKNGIQKSEI